MPHAVAVPPYFLTVRCAAGNPPSKRTNAKSKKTRIQKSGGAPSVGFGPRWQCVEGCGACCKLDKGPSFATPEEIFENPSDIELYRSLVGADGWCINYNKSSRTCSIYAVAVGIQLETYMVPNQKSSRTLIMRQEAQLLVNYFGSDRCCLLTSRRCRVYSFDLCMDSRILWLKCFTHTRNVPTDFVQLVYVIEYIIAGKEAIHLRPQLLIRYWGEDQFPHGAGFTTSEPLYGSGFMDKAEEAYLGEVHHGSSNYSRDNDVEMQPGFDYISWFGDEYGSEEDFHDHGNIGIGWDEKKLCESIFGYWPCLLEQNLES
ncbi:hypothetical protein RHMOL_Rhmol04G0253200 [Rhododendron molle]|uniref:Uncharacterized protein n=1 Tax=Rhododendron molle TaxID=49168 RepID=A0ACC0P5V9_RHOML|nr:hypothetical protein RHMOL_Rhmol04G0253200 [Rhododendron molle]